MKNKKIKNLKKQQTSQLPECGENEKLATSVEFERLKGNSLCACDLIANEQAVKETLGTLISIKNGRPRFFNIARYLKFGLIKEPKTVNGKTVFELSEKAEKILTV